MAAQVDHSTHGNIQRREQRNETKQRGAIPCTFADVYQLKDGARSSAIQDHLSSRLAQLSAMLHLIIGDDGLSALDALSGVVKGNYIWSCAMLADECRDLADNIETFGAAA